jgi:hypothetical protein
MVRLLPRALGVPEDAALAALHMALGGRTPKYWLWRHSFLVPASKTTKSWISSRKRAFRRAGAAPVERVVAGLAGFLPGQVVLLGVWMVP